MGSYDVCCSVSNLTIHCGDPTIYIPLEAYKYRGNGIPSDRNNTLIYRHCFYMPATLPITGLYDDYGRIGLIDKTDNTAVLEEFFGVSIEDICDMHSERAPKNIISGMFVLHDVYDALVKAAHIDEFGGKSSPLDFKKGNLMKDLSDKFDKYIGEMKEAEDLFNKLNDLGGVVGNLRRQGINIYASGVHSVFQFREHDLFNSIYLKHIMEGRFKEEMSKFVLFGCGMSGCNRFFFPAANGYQCGNDFAAKVLVDTSAKILRERLKEHRQREREDRIRHKEWKAEQASKKVKK